MTQAKRNAIFEPTLKWLGRLVAAFSLFVLVATALSLGMSSAFELLAGYYRRFLAIFDPIEPAIRAIFEQFRMEVPLHWRDFVLWYSLHLGAVVRVYTAKNWRAAYEKSGVPEAIYWKTMPVSRFVFNAVSGMAIALLLFIGIAGVLRMPTAPLALSAAAIGLPYALILSAQWIWRGVFRIWMMLPERVRRGLFGGRNLGQDLDVAYIYVNIFFVDLAIVAAGCFVFILTNAASP